MVPIRMSGCALVHEEDTFVLCTAMLIQRACENHHILGPALDATCIGSITATLVNSRVLSGWRVGVEGAETARNSARNANLSFLACGSSGRARGVTFSWLACRRLARCIDPAQVLCTHCGALMCAGHCATSVGMWRVPGLWHLRRFAVIPPGGWGPPART